ncbi:hypothetical protein [Parapedobacter sp. 2B3]|uniref:hypothetical protein n=1 Tax=Parapedobacter sp. 2B3 TaxID=3342381 RepID=UPI0035B6A24A
MTKSYPLFTLLAVLFFGACKKSDIEHDNSFERSYQTWLKFRESSGNTYRYAVSGATWAGSSWVTTITVWSGKVVQRDFRYEVFNDIRIPEGGWATVPLEEFLQALGFDAEDLPEQELEHFHDNLQWIETEAELGLHEQTPAGRVQTLDEVYETARAVWLKKRGDVDIFFEAKNDGLISSAGFVPNNCMDDCFSGIFIRSIEAID